MAWVLAETVLGRIVEYGDKQKADGHMSYARENAVKFRESNRLPSDIPSWEQAQKMDDRALQRLGNEGLDRMHENAKQGEKQTLRQRILGGQK